jgi:hypothetical protein
MPDHPRIDPVVRDIARLSPNRGLLPHGKLRSVAAKGQFTTRVRVAVARFLVGAVESVRVTMTA